jgi:glutathione S-transferase
MTELDTVRGAAPGAAGPALRQQQVEPVTLVQFPPTWGRNVSPFGLKLEAWLTLANIPFDIRTTMRLDKAPKGKLPYIIDQGHAIGDTSLIIAHLKHTRGIDPDAGLTPAERAQGLALQRLFEEHLYFIIVYSRWIDEEGWPLVAEAFFESVRPPLRSVAQFWFRERVRKMLYMQGLGRHEPAEIYAMGRADLEAIAEHLGDKPFFLGDRITTIDAVAYGHLANILLTPLETELKRMLRELPVLEAWCEAMEQGLTREAWA